MVPSASPPILDIPQGPRAGTIEMRKRPSARLLVLDPDDRVLLFRFEHKTGSLAGNVFWATPGGGLEPDESYEEAACRELLEETGLRIDDPGPEIHARQARFRTPDGAMVAADERFYLVRTERAEISQEGWDVTEREVMGEHRWWSMAELRSATEQVWPDDLIEVLMKAKLWG